jgi:ribosomal protein L5
VSKKKKEKLRSMRRNLHYQYEHLLWEDLLLKENPFQAQEVSRLQALSLSHSSSGYLLYERGLLASWVKLTLLTGKLPEKDQAKKYLANFKLIPKRVLGTSLKLEKIFIYAYLEKLLFFVFPKIRGFRGLVFVHKKTQINLQKSIQRSFSHELAQQSLNDGVRFSEAPKRAHDFSSGKSCAPFGEAPYSEAVTKINQAQPLTSSGFFFHGDTKLNKTFGNLYSKAQRNRLHTKFSSGQTFGLKQLTFFPEMEETGQFFEDIGGIHTSFYTNQPLCLPLLLTGLHFPCSQ